MNIKEFLDAKKMTQVDLADQINVTRLNVSKWIQGVHSPRLSHALMLQKLSKGKIKLEEMLSDRDTKRMEDFSGKR